MRVVVTLNELLERVPPAYRSTWLHLYQTEGLQVATNYLTVAQASADKPELARTHPKLRKKWKHGDKT